MRLYPFDGTILTYVFCIVNRLSINLIRDIIFYNIYWISKQKNADLDRIGFLKDSVFYLRYIRLRSSIDSF